MADSAVATTMRDEETDYELKQRLNISDGPSYLNYIYAAHRKSAPAGAPDVPQSVVEDWQRDIEASLALKVEAVALSSAIMSSAPLQTYCEDFEIIETLPIGTYNEQSMPPSSPLLLDNFLDSQEENASYIPTIFEKHGVSCDKDFAEDTLCDEHPLAWSTRDDSDVDALIMSTAAFPLNLPLDTMGSLEIFRNDTTARSDADNFLLQYVRNLTLDGDLSLGSAVELTLDDCDDPMECGGLDEMMQDASSVELSSISEHAASVLRAFYERRQQVGHATSAVCSSNSSLTSSNQGDSYVDSNYQNITRCLPVLYEDESG